MGFRLCIINPNSDESVTDHLHRSAAGVLPAGSRIESFTCSDSPPVIETAAESAAAAVSVVKASRTASDPDAFFVGCFGGPGVGELRADTGLPVVGLGEAALLQASYLSRRFGLVTTLDEGIPALWEQVAAASLRTRCVGMSAANSGSPEGGELNGAPGAPGAPGALLERLERSGRRLVGEGADAIVLACASFSPESARLSAALGVAVCDGTLLGPLLAHALWAAAR